MSANLIVEVINAIQDINARIDDIVSAPHLADYPASIENMQMPLCLTDLSTETGFSVNCGNSLTIIGLTTTIYIHPFALQYYGQVRHNIIKAVDDFRRKYRDEATYLYADKGKKILESAGLLVWIDLATSFRPVVPSTERPIEYPVGTGKFYHGVRISFNAIGRDGSGC